MKKPIKKEEQMSNEEMENMSKGQLKAEIKRLKRVSNGLKDSLNKQNHKKIIETMGVKIPIDSRYNSKIFKGIISTFSNKILFSLIEDHASDIYVHVQNAMLSAIGWHLKNE